ncbi:MAG: hypothetical protein ACREJO_09820 [Phycisphaerales bacterium]
MLWVLLVICVVLLVLQFIPRRIGILQYVFGPSTTSLAMNTHFLNSPRDVFALTAADPAVLNWANLNKAVDAINDELKKSASGEIVLQAPTSTQRHGTLDVNMSFFHFRCILDAVPSDVNPTRIVNFTVREFQPGTSEDPDNCTEENFDPVWRKAMVKIDAACKKAHASFPIGIRLFPEPTSESLPSLPAKQPPVSSGGTQSRARSGTRRRNG